MTIETKRSAIADRIRQLRKKKGYSQKFVAQDLSITQAAYSQIENSRNGILAEHIIRLARLFGTTTDYLLNGNNKLVKISFKTGFLPLIETEAHAAFVGNYEQRINFDDRDWFKIPGFNPSKDHRLFEVEGESMVPTIFPSDVLVCQVQKIQNLLYGTVIILVTETEIMVRRYKTVRDGKIILQCDNPDFPQQQVELAVSEIRQALTVRGKISGVLVPNHQILSNTKIKSLEETIDWLKKEMLLLNKKMEARRNEK